MVIKLTHQYSDKPLYLKTDLSLEEVGQTIESINEIEYEFFDDNIGVLDFNTNIYKKAFHSSEIQEQPFSQESDISLDVYWVIETGQYKPLKREQVLKDLILR